LDAKVDYLSFTINLDARAGLHSDHLYTEINSEFDKLKLFALKELLSESQPYQTNKRGRYLTGLRWEANNVNLWWGGLTHILCEVSGVGCQLLRDRGAMLDSVLSVHKRCSRLDIAVDLPDKPPHPREFVEKKRENRFPITVQYDEQTGATQYAGSRKSDRFARVYMYAQPHPRAGVLRVEHVMHGRYAKQAAIQLLADGLPTLVTILGNTFGWEHPQWQPSIVTEGKLRVKRHDKTDAGTLIWAIKAVAPALSRMHNNGLIDLDEFINTYVRPRLDK